MAARTLGGAAYRQGSVAGRGCGTAQGNRRGCALGVYHAGRQFDAAPASIDALREIRATTDLPLIFDSGIEGGLDILRAYACGANYVMLGRAFHYALAALGTRGIDHLIDILIKDITANMGQLGAKTLRDLPQPFTLA